MPSIRSSFLDDKYSKALLLLAILFFSWLASVKQFVVDWTRTAEDSKSAPPPNILLIVADDLGYNDTTAINSGGLPTPNLDQLARQGVVFRRHYADSTCTPSRVAMLTGRYPERSGFRPVGSEIPAEFLTIAERLKGAGYATYLTGKWHAGEDRVQAWPQNKGFDHWFGFLNQFELSGEVTESSKGRRRPTYHNPMLREDGGALQRYDGHLTDILTAHTIGKLRELQEAGKPWFLYHAFLAPHQPIQPDKRFASRHPDTPAGRYAALVEQMDDAIGRILQAVDRANTLVVFVSDNGGTNIERDNNYPFFGKKGDMYEGAFRTPLIFSWPEVIPAGRTVDGVVMIVDIYPTLLAAAKTPIPLDLDGSNLWPLFHQDNAIGARHRSWEVYSANVNTVSFSYLSDTGDWRLASLVGLAPRLFDLKANPAGASDVTESHQAVADELTHRYWQEHWRKSQLAVSESRLEAISQTIYRGFDAMRTPQRYGFSIGLEIGPLTTAQLQPPDRPFYVVAGQESVWELQYKPGHGLEWHMGDIVLRDPYFKPSECNAVVLTGYFEPKTHLAVRDPQSQIKLYSSGFLRDASSAIKYDPPDDNRLAAPTFVNYNGAARFSNLMLSSFADNYSPRLLPQYMDAYTSAYREKSLSLPDVRMLDSELCKQGRPQSRADAVQTE
jgi:arylsulfatase A-like enzyme